MESDHSPYGDKERLEDLEREAKLLREENKILRQERDQAVKAQDALLEKVIPLAVPGGEPESSRPSGLSRIFTLALCVMLLLALVLAAHYFPRIVRALNENKKLPPSVHVQERR